MERLGEAAVLRYASPPMGYMTARGAEAMLAEVERASDDPDVRAIVLTGGLPDVFVRHYDVGEILHAGALVRSGVSSPQDFESGVFGRLTDAVAAAPKPVIAAINGACMGGGFELALACDLRIASRSVKAIGLPETRIGIFPGGGGTQRLPRIVGEAKALELILRGIVFDARGALKFGLVHEVVRDSLARALEIAAEIEGRGAEGIAAAKRLTRAALSRPLSEGLAEERRSFAEVLRAQSAMDAMTRFVQGDAGLESM